MFHWHVSGAQGARAEAPPPTQLWRALPPAGGLARHRCQAGRRANSSRVRSKPPQPSCAVRLGRGELRLLLGARLLLVLGLPFLVRHAVNDLARTILAQFQTLSV